MAKTPRTVLDRLAKLAGDLIGLRPRPALVPVPVRTGRPVRNIPTDRR